MIAAGEVRDLNTGTTRMRVVVLSRDEVNIATEPVVAQVSREPQDIPPYVVALGDHDPIRGAVLVAQLLVANPADLSEPVAIVSGATFERLVDAATSLFREP